MAASRTNQTIFYRNLREITFRLTNVIPERIIFVSRGITVLGRSRRVAEYGWSGVRIPIGGWGFSHLWNVQTGSGDHPEAYTYSFPSVKRTVHKADHSVPFIVGVTEWSYTSIPPIRLRGVKSENLYPPQPLLRPTYIIDDNIKEKGWEGTGYGLGVSCFRAVMNRQVAWKAVHSLTSWGAIASGEGPCSV